MPYWAALGNCSAAKEYEVVSVEPSDVESIPAMISYKLEHEQLKVVASIGGWNFPSAYFSKMVSTEVRAALRAARPSRLRPPPPPPATHH
jgi:GH18 family chitinase